MTSKNHADAQADSAAKNLSRRDFGRLAAATTMAAAGATAGAGSAAASSGLDFGSGLVQDPRIPATVTVAEHQSDFDSLDYTDDSGNHASLRDVGTVIEPNDDPDTVHNPVTLRADKFNVDEYVKFPRGEVYDEDGDGSEDTDLDVIDSTHWSVDTSGSAGSMSVSDVTSPADGRALNVSTSSQASGDVAIASFSDFSITDGESRKLLQLVLSVNTLNSGAIVTIRLVDDDGDKKEVTIDSSADTSNLDVVANSTVTGKGYQVQLGELSTVADGDGSWGNIERLEVEVADANADITFVGINCEKESKWSWGTEEYLNSDSEVDTRSVEETSGEFSVTSLGSVDDVLLDGTIADVTYSVEIQASETPGSWIDYEFTESDDVYDRAHQFRALYNFDVPSAYDLSWSISSLDDEVLYPGGRYVEAGFVTGEDDTVTLDDVDNDDVTLTDRTSTYQDASTGSEVTLSSSISSGSVTAAYVEHTASEDDRDAMEGSSDDSPVAAGAATDSSGGFFSGIRGTMMAIGAVVAGIAAYLKNAA